jgi:hypothetical protein
MREHFRARIYSRRSIATRGLNEMNGSSLESFVTHTKSYFFLSQCRATSQHAVHQDQGVGVLCVVFPWAQSVLARCNYLQLDTIFQAVDPYILSVSLAIIANESFQLGHGPDMASQRAIITLNAFIVS